MTHKRAGAWGGIVAKRRPVEMIIANSARLARCTHSPPATSPGIVMGKYPRPHAWYVADQSEDTATQAQAQVAALDRLQSINEHSSRCMLLHSCWRSLRH